MTSLIYRVSPPPLADGQQIQPQSDAVGNLRVQIAASDGDAAVAEITATAVGAGVYSNMPIDTTGFGSITWHFSTVGNGSNRHLVEGSNDGVNWVGLSGRCVDVVQASSEGSLINQVASLSIGRTTPCATKFIRFRQTTHISGTDTVVAKLRRAAGLGPIVVEQGIGNGATPWAIQGNINENGSFSPSAGHQPMLEGRTSNKAAVTSGSATRPIATAVGAQIVRPYSIPEADWSFAAGASGIVNSTADVALAAAAGAGLRNYLTGLQISHDTLGAVTEFVIKDGSAIIYRGKLQTAASETSRLEFPSPLKTSANTALNFTLLTSVTGGVYINAQGYIAP